MSSLGSIVEALKEGNVIAYPTEGVWGLGCDPLNEAAVLKLISLKNRSIAVSYTHLTLPTIYSE